MRSIILTGSELRFAPGSFQVPTSDFTTLRRRVEEIREAAAEYGINTIEVVGHTDGEPVGSNRTSNLDVRLGSAATISQDSIRGASPADNVGLGMLRAIAVAEFLEDELRGEGFTILTLSAGQLIDTSDRPRVSPFNVERVERRRVEIRLRRTE